MTTNKIIKAYFGGAKKTVSEHRYQYDYGQTLLFADLELPDAYEVHFSNAMTGGTTITQIGTSEGVSVPDELLTSGANVYAFIFLHDGETDGRTMYTVEIPVRQRSKPSDVEPTP